ncbi:MAG TPA: tyrosine-type recombinase/integrase [Gemmatimonadales bacterium]|nr:tyrosine-type recombinase/integrase [Gemmatimonadales bacterium]
MDFRHARLKVVSGRDGHRTKTGKSRVLPLSRRMLDAFRAHFESYRFQGGSPWLFHHIGGDRHAAAGDRLNDLRRAFGNAAKRAGLPANLWPYDLRHTRITRWVAAGHNLALVQKAAGHASMHTTMIYVHLADDDLGVLVEDGPRTVDLARQLRAS